VIEAESDGGGIRDVVGIGEGAELQFGLDGVLHLFLWCFAAAGEESLDLGRGVLEEGNMGFGDGKEDDTANVREEEGGAEVASAGEDLFDGGGFGVGISDDFADSGGDFKQSKLEWSIRVGLDDTTFAEYWSARRAFNECIAGAFESGVKTEVACLRGG
jgi:hypothetical protein